MSLIGPFSSCFSTKSLWYTRVYMGLHIKVSYTSENLRFASLSTVYVGWMKGSKQSPSSVWGLLRAFSKYDFKNPDMVWKLAEWFTNHESSTPTASRLTTFLACQWPSRSLGLRLSDVSRNSPTDSFEFIPNQFIHSFIHSLIHSVAWLTTGS